MKKPLTQAQQADMKVIQSIQTNLNAGLSYKKIAILFNMAKTSTRQGKKWSAVQVGRVVRRNQLKPEKLSLHLKDRTPLNQDQLIKIVRRREKKPRKKS